MRKSPWLMSALPPIEKQQRLRTLLIYPAGHILRGRVSGRRYAAYDRTEWCVEGRAAGGMSSAASVIEASGRGISMGAGARLIALRRRRGAWRADALDYRPQHERKAARV
jgi:hypothetical protein